MFLLNSALRRKIFSGSAANVLSISTVIASQIISVPVMLSGWGVDQYGLWLMFMTLPSYFAMTDFGFIQASITDVKIKVARGEQSAALSVFAGAAVLTFCAAMSVAAIAVLITLTAQLAGWIEFYPVIYGVILYGILCILSRISIASFVCSDRYATGTALFNAFGFAELLIMLFCVYMGGGHLTAIAALILGRMVSIGLMLTILSRLAPWFRPNVMAFRWAHIQHLVKPAIGALVLPAALMCSLQGAVLIVGSFVSPAAAAPYAIVRTMSRILIQAVGVVNSASMPIVSEMFGAGGSGLKNLIRLNLAVMGIVMISGGVFLVAFGPQVVTLWTKGEITPSRLFVILMTLVALLHGGWYFIYNIILSTNQHVLISRDLAILSLLSLICMLIGAWWGGLNGVAVGLAASELFCFVRIWYAVFRMGLLR